MFTFDIFKIKLNMLGYLFSIDKWDRKGKRSTYAALG